MKILHPTVPRLGLFGELWEGGEPSRLQCPLVLGALTGCFETRKACLLKLTIHNFLAGVTHFSLVKKQNAEHRVSHGFLFPHSAGEDPLKQKTTVTSEKLIYFESSIGSHQD